MNKKVITGLMAAQQMLVAGSAFAAGKETPKADLSINEQVTTVDGAIQLITLIGGVLLAVAGAISIVFLVIGGIRYIVSAGNPTQTEGAKKTIIYALIGIVVIALSFAAVMVVNNVFNNNT